MCYKLEKHKHLTEKLSEKLKDVPNFIADFFDRYKSAATKNCNWGYIRDLLQFLIDKEYIKEISIADITMKDMNMITCNHIIKYLDGLKLGTVGRKNSLDSICTKKNVFSAFWNYMFLNKYVDDNIIRYMPGYLYKSESTIKEVKIPTDKQLEDFIANLSEGNNNEFNIVRNLAIVKLFIGSGIRSEELINLDIKDLHLHEEEPFVMILGKGKIEHYDKVLISQSAKIHLEDYLTQRAIFVKNNKINDDALFLSNERRRMGKTAIKSFFDTYSNEEINPHMLRHYAGTVLYRKTKGNIVLVQRQLRHASLEVAARYYVHISDDELAGAVATM